MAFGFGAGGGGQPDEPLPGAPPSVNRLSTVVQMCANLAPFHRLTHLYPHQLLRHPLPLTEITRTPTSTSHALCTLGTPCYPTTSGTTIHLASCGGWVSDSASPLIYCHSPPNTPKWVTEVGGFQAGLPFTGYNSGCMDTFAACLGECGIFCITLSKKQGKSGELVSNLPNVLRKQLKYNHQ